MKTKSNRMAGPTWLWAIVVVSQRSNWIYYPSIARTRKEAVEKYQGDWPKENYASRQLKRGDIRMARVVVTEAYPVAKE
jgi:hypothetical protein